METSDLSAETFKKLRRHYYILWLALLALGLMGISALDQSNPLVKGSEVLEKIKSVIIVFTLFSIPGIFAWFTSRTKKMEEQEDLAVRNKLYEGAWKARIWVILSVSVINLAAYMLTFDRTLMYLLAIVVFIFFYCRPNIVKAKQTEEI